jgi:glycosyltransferase involved in cell wall biosynthesis
MNARRKVAYVVYNERPSSGLMRTQVIALLKEIASRDVSIDLTMIAIWQPWVMRRFRAEIAALGLEMAQAGIRVRNLPWALVPTRHFAYRAFLLPILAGWVRLLMYLALRERYDVVHCRGYLPSYGAAKARSALGHRLIFDMRSMWAREHVTIGAWRADDRINHLWERIERETVVAADASIGVSPGMVDQIRAIDARGRAVHVPICVDLDDVRFHPEARDQLRQELGWQSNRIIVYQGSLGLMNSNLAEVAEVLGPISRALPDSRFLVLTNNRDAAIGGLLSRYGIDASRFAVRHPQRSDLSRWVSAGDAGIHAMSPGPDSATRLGVKVVEYLSCSLPLIVNPHVGAAAALVREHDVGVVLDDLGAVTIRARLEALFGSAPVPHAPSRDLAAGTFSLQACADRYLALYNEGAVRAETADARS